MDTILVLMQVGRDGDWSDRGVPEVVTGYDRAPTPSAAGAEWMFDHHPTPIGDNWRLLVWADVRTGSWNHDQPDAVITPTLYRASIGARRLDRGRSRRRRPRLQPQPVTQKVRAHQIGVGDLVLLTQDRSNTTARTSSGPWYIADHSAEGCVAARVRRVDVLTRGEQTTITLGTTLGDIDRLPAEQPAIPVDED